MRIIPFTVVGRLDRATAIRDHRPTAGEILDFRFGAGWTPTPTALKIGERVLGHAACPVAPHADIPLDP